MVSRHGFFQGDFLNPTLTYFRRFSLSLLSPREMATFRAFGSVRFYAVVAALVALLGVAAVFAGSPSESDAYGPWMSEGDRLDDGGRQPDNYCPDLDRPGEPDCRFLRNWTCRTQEVNDEPVGELCMWADCTACSGCLHLDEESDDHFDPCCETDADGNCVSGYCIESDHEHGTPDLDYCAPCISWRWRVEGRPAYSTYRDQLGRLMTFDEYIKAAVETTHSNEVANVDAINLSLFLGGVPHYERPPVREHSPYYLAPSALSSLTDADGAPLETAQGDSITGPSGWNLGPQSGVANIGEPALLPMHTQMLPDDRFPMGTYDFYAVDPRDRPVYPGVTPSPLGGETYGRLLGPPGHTEALYNPSVNYRMGHISAAEYKFVPVCPYLDPSVAHRNPSSSCPGSDEWKVVIDGSDLRDMIRGALPTSPQSSMTESALLEVVANGLGLDWLRDRAEIGRLRKDIISPGFEILPDSAYSPLTPPPGLVERPVGTPAWIYSWPTATPGPTPRYTGSVDDETLPDFNVRVSAADGHLVTGLRVIAAGGDLCHAYTRSLVLDWNFLDGALFYEIEVWDVNTQSRVTTRKSYTTRANIDYLELSPCDGSNPVEYELVVRAYDYTGQRNHADGHHRSRNVSQFETSPPPGPVSAAGNIRFTMPTAPEYNPCAPDPCFCKPVPDT